MYHFGRGQERNFRNALKSYTLAIKTDYAPALNNLATMYRFGQGVTIDYERAISMYEKAAGERSLAKYNLGDMYFKGQGVDKDQRQAAI